MPGCCVPRSLSNIRRKHLQTGQIKSICEPEFNSLVELVDMVGKSQINRRTYLLASVTGATSLAGCSQSPIESYTSPDLAVSDAAQPEPIVDELDREGDEYSGRLENTGIGGQIRAELYFAESEEGSTVLEDSQTLQLDADEQTRVQFTAERPDWVEGFFIEAFGITYVVNVRNTGSEAVAVVSLVDGETGDTVEETEVSIPAESTRQVDLTTEHRFEEGFDVQTSLIDW